MIISMFLQLGGRVPMAVQLGSEVVEPVDDPKRGSTLTLFGFRAVKGVNYQTPDCLPPHRFIWLSPGPIVYAPA